MTFHALNGLDRIGKLALKPLLDHGAEIAWINDVTSDPAMPAHLPEFDTVRGRWAAAFANDTQSVRIDGTGAFRTEAKLVPCSEAGVPKAVVSAPVTDGSAANIVSGVNHHISDPAQEVRA